MKLSRNTTISTRIFNINCNIVRRRNVVVPTSFYCYNYTRNHIAKATLKHFPRDASSSTILQQLNFGATSSTFPLMKIADEVIQNCVFNRFPVNRRYY